MPKLTGIAVCLLLFLGAAAAEDDKPKLAPMTPDQAADAVLRALDAKDGNALKTIAASEAPDPWLVAAALCARKRFEAARSLALAMKDGRGKPLATQVDAERALPPSAKAWAQLVEVEALEDPSAVVARTKTLPSEAHRICDVKLRVEGARALRRLEQWQASIAFLAPAGEGAERMGWHRMRYEARLKTGGAHVRMGQRARAVDLMWEAAEIAREGARPNDRATALFVAGVLGARSDLARASRALQEAARVRLSLGDVAEAYKAYRALGLYQIQFGTRKDSIAPLEKALALAEQLKNAREILVVAEQLAVSHEGRGHLAKAIETVRRALAFLDGHGLRAGRGKMLAMAAGYVLAQRRFEEAARLAGESAAAWEREGNKLEQAGALFNRVTALRAAGELRAASEACSRAQALLGPSAELAQHPTLALDLATALSSLGRYREAIPYFQVMVDWKGLQLEATPETAFMRERNLRLRFNTLRMLSIAQRRSWDFEGAHATARVLVGVARDRAAPLDIATSLRTLATSQAIQGQRAQELTSLEEALGIARAAKSNADVADTMRLLCGALAGLGQHERALGYAQEAVRINRELGRESALASSLKELADVLQELDRHKDARPALEEAIAILVRRDDLSGEFYAQHTLARLLDTLGEKAAADQAFARTDALARELGTQVVKATALLLRVRQATMHGDLARAEELAREAVRLAKLRSVLAGSYGVLGGVLVVREKWPDACSAMRRAVELSALEYDQLDDATSAEARGSLQTNVDVGLESAARAGLADDALYFLEVARARGLLTSLGGRERLSGSIVPPALREQELAALELRTRAEHGLQRALETRNRKESRYWKTQREEADTALADVMNRIQRDARTAADIYCPVPATPDDIQAALDPKSAFVSFGFAPTFHVAVVVTRAGVRVVRCGASDAIEKAVDAWEDPAELGKLLVDPLQLPDTVGRVLLSVPAHLMGIPWCRLLPGRDLACVPSATSWMLLRELPRAGGSKVLAIGDPAHGRRLPRLASAAAEAKAVGDKTLLGGEGTEAAFREASGAPWRAIHLACHGLMDQDQPFASGLALTPAPPDDGLLEAREFLRLRLRTDLVVLSACDSGRGKSYRGEGVLGLTRALMYAGCPRVLVSTWKVDDEATRALMTRFYQLWNPDGGAEGLGAAAALRQAQAYVREHPEHPKWKDPYYWSAWVLWGLPD